MPSSAPPRVRNEAPVEEPDTYSLELDGESGTDSNPGFVLLEKKVFDSGPINFTQHLRERDTGLLCHVATLVARGCVPQVTLQVLRMGRLTALKKPQGGVRWIVVSVVF